MDVTFKIKRTPPERGAEPWWQEFRLKAEPGMAVLAGLYEIQDYQDGTLAFRYSCRGAICGSCAMRINGVSALACKTQISKAAGEDGTIVLEPLLNMPVIRDLVVDQEPFFEEMRKTRPWLVEDHTRKPDEPVDYAANKSAQEYDQWNRSAYCIRCQACFSDCPKRQRDPGFIGPEACVEIYKRVYDPREAETAARLKLAGGKGGVFDCARYGNCVKVCPKDVRPMRAILFLQKKIEGEK